MTVIFGMWHRDGAPRAQEDAVRMASALAPYGPDRQGMWHDGSVALGRALAMTLPEDVFDRQPLRGGGATALVADLRLDNRAELCRDLGIVEAESRFMADAAILLAAWDRWGEACLDRLLGEFAFAIWDGTARRLFCARDHLGLRPFHYYTEGAVFAFASLPKGLHALPEVPREIDDVMIMGRLALLPEAHGRSFFKHVHRLPPGHAMTVTPSEVIVRRYWRPEPERRLVLGGDDEYVEAFRALLDEAVRCRLRSIGPIGSQLSGGYDSTTVTATAARLFAAEGKSLLAFTSVPSPDYDGTAPAGRFGDEGPHAASVAAMYPNIRHVLTSPTDACPLDLVTRLHLVGVPIGHMCLLPDLDAAAKACADHGVRTVLTGAMGNVTISYDGLPLLPALLRQGHWLRWWSEASMLAQRHGARSWRLLLATSVGPFLPAPLWAIMRRTFGRGPLSAYRPLNPGLAAERGLKALAEATGWDVNWQPWADGRRMRAAMLSHVDFGSFAHNGTGIERRDPTADRRLVDFCLAIPEDQFLRRGTTKFLLRRAMAGRLPPTILNERRSGFVGADWYLRVAPHRDRFAEAVARLEASPTARRCLDLPQMRRLIDQWPKDDWNSRAVLTRYRAYLLRGVAVGEFIRWVEGGNA